MNKGENTFGGRRAYQDTARQNAIIDEGCSLPDSQDSFTQSPRRYMDSPLTSQADKSVIDPALLGSYRNTRPPSSPTQHTLSALTGAPPYDGAYHSATSGFFDQRAELYTSPYQAYDNAGFPHLLQPYGQHQAVTPAPLDEGGSTPAALSHQSGASEHSDPSTNLPVDTQPTSTRSDNRVDSQQPSNAGLQNGGGEETVSGITKLMKRTSVQKPRGRYLQRFPDLQEEASGSAQLPILEEDAGYLTPEEEDELSPLPNPAFCCRDMKTAYKASTEFVYTHLKVARVFWTLFAGPTPALQVASRPVEHHSQRSRPLTQVETAIWLIGVAKIFPKVSSGSVKPHQRQSNPETKLGPHAFFMTGLGEHWAVNEWIRVTDTGDENFLKDKLTAIDCNGYNRLRIGCPNHNNEYAVGFWARSDLAQVEQNLSTSIADGRAREEEARKPIMPQRSTHAIPEARVPKRPQHPKPEEPEEHARKIPRYSFGATHPSAYRNAQINAGVVGEQPAVGMLPSPGAQHGNQQGRQGGGMGTRDNFAVEPQPPLTAEQRYQRYQQRYGNQFGAIHGNGSQDGRQGGHLGGQNGYGAQQRYQDGYGVQEGARSRELGVQNGYGAHQRYGVQEGGRSRDLGVQNGYGAQQPRQEGYGVQEGARSRDLGIQNGYGAHQGYGSQGVRQRGDLGVQNGYAVQPPATVGQPGQQGYSSQVGGTNVNGSQSLSNFHDRYRHYDPSQFTSVHEPALQPPPGGYQDQDD
ncbi:uncharacterized protein LY89DRAFT_669086 [Mollisia scopiformis]|uniref:Uncharacterized protein n=1 Tax=Mollisia scopiformis TaxID=149040 RepID=A0A194XCB0_MOLSC|nr:uncharacterized protein LY89DRAFT_669086 [Mollisia scopiformis]KUJ17799.1 hypothetical protein LY89DRAFT_669086 [Mollisia scopiformis]